ncbi:MAG: hypothetical protein PHU56_00090 [Candidatus Pacebacteria bacterium]|nr:hypothetical protein [Candidatus Paceibacterota bacterium]
MPLGRAKCKACGIEVTAEMETDIKCSKCGRIFQIPNEPRYFLKSRLANHSISTLAPRINIEMHSLFLSQEAEEEAIKPYARQGKRVPKPFTFISLSSEQEPEIIEEQAGAWVLIDMPGHESLRDVEYVFDGISLSIGSMKFSFKREFHILDGKAENVNLKNGIFSFFIRKEQ